MSVAPAVLPTLPPVVHREPTALYHPQLSNNTTSIPSVPSDATAQVPATPQTSGEVRIISHAEVLERIWAPEPARSILIDVREPAEVVEGMIPSAIHIPLATVGDALKLQAIDFEWKYGVSKPSLEDEVVIYCRSGRRSTLAADVAKEHGYTNILNYKGSWLDWVANQKAHNP